MFSCLVVESPGAPPGIVESIARACSPRVAPHGDDAIVFDVRGLTRACGPPDVIAREVQRMAAEHGLIARVAVADTMTAAWILAHARSGTTVACGRSRAALAELPTAWLATVLDLDRAIGARHRPDEWARDEGSIAEGQRPSGSGRRSRARNYRVAPPPSSALARTTGRAPTVHAADREERALCLDRLATFERWGIRTCGALAGLTRSDIHARMGPIGVRLHQASHGEDAVPLVPAGEAPVFADRVELEWPVDGLEPLTFVLARQCERLATALERADRGAVAIHTTLSLVTRDVHERHLTLPAPLRDARVLRTLIGLDLESHPPGAAVDVVAVRLDVTPGRILQGSLLAWAAPTPEDLSTLLARLGALVGVSRVGTPVCPDTHDRRQVAMAPFQVETKQRVSMSFAETRCPDTEARCLDVPLRRFRLPIAARVVVEHGTPIEVWPSARDLTGGRVVTCAGPWRTSGFWWTPLLGADPAAAGRADHRAAWDRDEWDVELDGVVYRLARQRASGGWEVEGVFD